MKIYAIIPILLLLPFSLSSQNNESDVSFVFKNLNSDNGLSQSNVIDILQDKDGFMWFATHNGINRYDGYNFKTYKFENDSTTLKSYFISKLFMDSRGNVWAGSNNGVGIYSKKKDKFIDLNHITGSKHGIHQVEDMLEDKKGVIWLATTSGLLKYYPDKNILEQVIPIVSIGFPYLHISHLELSEDGNIYLTAEDGLYFLNTKTIECKLISKLDNTNSNHTDIKEYIYSMTTDSAHNLWLGSFMGNLYTFDTKKMVLTKIKDLNATIVCDFFVANDSIIYIALDIYGIIRYNIKTHLYERIYDLNNTNKQIANGKVISVWIDKQNNLWTGHFQAGISFTQLENSGFGLVNYQKNLDTQINITSVSAILKDSKGYLWVGTDGEGIIRYYPNSSEYEIIRNKPEDPKSLPFNSVLCFFEDSNGQIWIGTYRGGLTKYNRESHTFFSYKHNENNTNSISSNDIRAITEDEDGNLWIVCHGSGIAKFNPQTEIFTNFKNHEDGSNSLVNPWTFDFDFDSNGCLWITTSKGVSRFDIEKGYFYNYVSDLTSPKSIHNDFIHCVFCDSGGRVWLGTDQGLVQYISHDDMFELHPSDDNRSKKSVYSIEEDAKGNLWISTNKGLLQYDPDNKKIKKFTVSDGLQANEFIRTSSFKAADGTLYFGGINGFNFFEPSKIKSNTAPPDVEITMVDLMGKSIHISKLKEENEFRYDQNFFTFHFVALNYKSSDKNRYKFKLEGLDKDWNKETDQREAIYTSLPPGKYTFRAIACNNDGVWNNEGALFSFRIFPPWYASWWFRAMVILVVALSITTTFYSRLQRIRKQNRLLEQKVQERTMELNDANIKLVAHQNKIEAQNKILVQQNNFISEKNAELQEKSEEITTQRDILEDLNKTKDKFFSIIAHDLKNPLNAMMGFAELLNTSYDAFPDQKKKSFINIILNSSKNLFALLENLLHWARSQSGAMIFNPKLIDINGIIQENIITLKHPAAKKGISLCHEFNDKIEATADENMLNTVIRNLTSNAIKFTPTGGNINFNVSENTTNILITVEDSGVGMTPEQIESLFKIDTNISTKGTDSETGTGLGLILCKEFINRHKGKIWAKSEAGKGSTFYIQLPK